jgi:tetratricopeptide (TPR) repeat protein
MTIRWITSGAVLITMLLIGGCTSDADRLATHQKTGDHFMNEERYREAVIEYRNAAQLAPDSAIPHYKLGTALLNLGTRSDLHNAFTEFTKAVQADATHLDAQLKLGLMFLVSGQHERALEKANLVLASKPDYDEAQLLKGQSLVALGEPEKARQEFLAVLKRDPNASSAHTALAAVLVSQRRLNEAEKHFKAAVDADPNSPKSRLLLAAFYGGSGQHDQAQSVLEETLRLAPDTVPAYTALSQYQLRSGNADAAQATLEALIKTVPTHHVGYQSMSSLHKQQGNPEAAKAILETGILKAENSVDLRVQLAEMHIREGQLERVTAQAEALLQSETGQVMGHFFTGLVALAERHSQEAVDEFSRVIDDRPRLALAHYYLGKAHGLSGNTSGAKESFIAALEEDEELLPARVALARLRLAKGHLEEARGDVNTLTRLAAGMPETLHLAGLIAMADHNYSGAAATFALLTKRLPNASEPYYRLGRALLAQGQNKAGHRALETAFNNDPSRTESLELLVQSEVLAGNKKSAEKRLRTAAAAMPESAAIQHILGRLLVQSGNMDEGIKAFEAAIQADPGYIPAYGSLGSLYAVSERHEDAIKQLTTGLEKDPKNPGARMLLAVVLEQAGQTEAAIDHYKTVLDALPTFAPAANNLAWLYAHGAGNLDVALTLAQTAREYAPQDAGVADTLGWIYHLKGIYMRAEGLLDEALKAMPEHPVLLYHAGINSLKLEKPDKARSYLQQAIKSDVPFAERAKAETALKEIGLRPRQS